MDFSQKMTAWGIISEMKNILKIILVLEVAILISIFYKNIDVGRYQLFGTTEEKILLDTKTGDIFLKNDRNEYFINNYRNLGLFWENHRAATLSSKIHRSDS